MQERRAPQEAASMRTASCTVLQAVCMQQCACSMLMPTVNCRSVQGPEPHFGHHFGQYHQAQDSNVTHRRLRA
jgi:hypothetical protein